MSVSPEAKILRALNQRLSSLTPAIPVAWPETPFQPGSQPYLRPTLLSAETTQSAVGNEGTKVYRGLYQVSLFWPEKQGLVGATEKAGTIIAHFAKGTVMVLEGVTVRVENPPDLAPAVSEPGWVQLPVSVSYISFV